MSASFLIDRDSKSVLAGGQRVFVALVGGLLIVLLALAAMLHADKRGWGTHEQLGVPPCTFVVLFGMRCPSCGMTTAWVHLVQGRPLEALQAHVVGTMLAAAACGGGIWMLACAALGRWFLGRPSERILLPAAFVTLVLLTVEWGIRLSGY